MNKDKMKLRIIEEVVDLGSETYTNALYEIIVNEDYDYIPDLFDTKEDFEEFIEKWTPGARINMEDENYIEIMEDGYCEEDGKQSDLTFWFSYYDKRKKCFIFNDAHCFVCDNELELEIGEENLNNYFNKAEVKILLEKKKENDEM